MTNWKKIVFGVLLLVFASFTVVGAESSRKSQAKSPFLLTVDELKDARAFILKLRISRDPVSLFLINNCSPRTRRLVNAYIGNTPPSNELCNALVRDLNRLIQAESLYDKERFAQVELSEPTLKLLEQEPGEEYLHLNRLLLSDAYPDELERISFEPMDISADSMEYDSNKDLLIASGHVAVRQYDEMLRCDHAIINRQTHDVYAEGNVYYQRGSDAWSGDSLRYNFKTHRGNFGEFVAFMDPFYVRAKTSRRVSKDKFLFRKAIVTTCESESPLAYLKAHTLWMTPGRHVRGRHVLLHLGWLPVMYSPFWNQNIGDPNFISIVPGYNSRMSVFLLTAFNYRLSRRIEAATHLDYRVKRGPGIGQDIMWSSSGNAKGLSTERYEDDKDDLWYFGYKSRWSDDIEEEDDDSWFGDLITYYTHDSWPDEGETQEYPIDNDRYRMRLYHSHSIDERNYFLSQINYLSDPKILEQFFREEYEHNPEPDNYLVLGHRGDKYDISLEMEKRLNDFYSSLNRFPYASANFTRQQIFRSPFYYEGETTAGYLEQVWESNKTNKTDYAAFRFDTDHNIYYPMKWFRVLNIIPRAGGRGTYYSKTKEDYTEIIETSSIDSNGVTTVSSVTNDLTRELSGEFRSLYELGVETSFKAFKVWETYPDAIIHNLRHIAEPYIDYTLVPEPNVNPTNLYQFDKIDELGKENKIKLGMRNKLQTKMDDEIYDLINADIWTYYHFDREEGKNDFSNISFDIRSTLYEDWLKLKIDGELDQYDSLFKTFNTRLTIQDDMYFKNQLEHRYKNDDSNLLNNKLTLTPFVNWKFSVYARYEFEDQDMEAWGFAIQKIVECITVQAGFEELDDDYTFWIQFWFTEFPKARIDVGM